MDAVAVANRYFEAWNRRDPAAILASFTEGGAYSDPAAGEGVSGEAIAEYARGLFSAFPDLSFEIISVDPAGSGRVAAQWRMQGTNTGSLAGLPPTGAAVDLPGADFIEVEGDRLRSVRGYFDQRAFAEQLGLQVLVQPQAAGPFTFGRSTALSSGKRTKPGAFSVTALEVRDGGEVAETTDLSRRVAVEMAQMPGFIGWVGVVIGTRMLTVTAWENPDDPRELMRVGTHAEAVKRFFGPGFAVGGFTSVWTPHRINTMWVRCLACDRMADADREGGRCACGADLTHATYW
jgi:steroid delta-isomerase-like uncharacterized protein